MSNASPRARRRRSRAVATGLSVAGVAGVAAAFIDQGAAVASHRGTQVTVTDQPGSAVPGDLGGSVTGPNPGTGGAAGRDPGTGLSSGTTVTRGS